MEYRSRFIRQECESLDEVEPPQQLGDDNVMALAQVLPGHLDADAPG